jgi:hypothetical protein
MKKPLQNKGNPMFTRVFLLAEKERFEFSPYSFAI